jgi:hypothetical protein
VNELKNAALYLDGECIGEVEGLKYSYLIDTEDEDAVTGLSSDIINAFTSGVVTTTIEATFPVDAAAFEHWLSGFSGARPLTRAERRAKTKARRTLRRDLVRLAGSHNRWSWPEPCQGFGRFFYGASVPRSFR